MRVKTPDRLDFGEILPELSLPQVLVPRPDEVKNYLSQYPRLGRELSGACAAVRQDLGPDYELSLELYRDPEIDDQYLTLYVRKWSLTGENTLSLPGYWRSGRVMAFIRKDVSAPQ